VKLDFGQGALRPIGETQMQVARELARGSERARAIVRYHDHEEGVQRMLHAIEPRSYVRPHRHEGPKTEVFLAVTGSALVCRFDASGALEEHLEIRAGGPQFGCEIPPGSWHGLFACEPDTVLYEVIEGAYDPDSHKHYASWAPAEGSAEAPAFLAELRRRVGLAPAGAR
jgi:cupin fold WbuC family metalloprotein